MLALRRCLGTGILLAHGLGQVTRSLDFADLGYVLYFQLCTNWLQEKAASASKIL